MDADLEWELPLRKRRGSPKRLAGLDVYYDFEWLDYFRDERAQFQNGMCLARQIRNACPRGKTPALLLTTRDDVEERPIETASSFFVVVNFPRYLAEATGDPAVSYWARGLGIGRLSEFADARPEEIRAFLELHLSSDRIAEWAASDGTRLESIRRIPAVQGISGPAGVNDVLSALQSLEALDSNMVIAIAELLGPEVDRHDRLRLLRALTNDPHGRYDTGEVLVERARDRLQDAHRAVTDYELLIADSGTIETDVQLFLEQNLWLLGLDYAQMRHRAPLPRGEMDFILERFDGYHDVLELKSPQDRIVVTPGAEGAPPSASAFALSPALAGALAQVHVYRDILTSDESTMERLYGLSSTRDPRLIIVIGNAASLPDYSRRVLRELNKSLHHVEVVPYDVLGRRAAAVLENVESYVLAASD